MSGASAGTGWVVGYTSLFRWDEFGREEGSYIGERKAEVRGDERALQATKQAHSARCALISVSHTLVPSRAQSESVSRVETQLAIILKPGQGVADCFISRVLSKYSTTWFQHASRASLVARPTFCGRIHHRSAFFLLASSDVESAKLCALEWVGTRY